MNIEKIPTNYFEKWKLLSNQEKVLLYTILIIEKEKIDDNDEKNQCISQRDALLAADDGKFTQTLILEDFLLSGDSENNYLPSVNPEYIEAIENSWDFLAYLSSSAINKQIKIDTTTLKSGGHPIFYSKEGVLIREEPDGTTYRYFTLPSVGDDKNSVIAEIDRLRATPFPSLKSN